MKNSKWKIHKVGLINFWYYDEEEFYFRDGRMLLRGANGSGKSVTMQSFIPLLLDGNMRPERLDPFGSRARKMENYLLEEDDERDERTGYLYMELKRVEADRYISIGIGMRGRKNKKLDTWYFYINDGKRIGTDIPLYKDVQSKIPFSKIELRNRIGESGTVLDTQSEYMESVNRLLFGFDTMEEYKELLELLIQLRTPKLSKDFKPSVINEILGSSLQTLSEDDLRPMSEAIENMDNIKTNLDTLKDSIKAANSIQTVYEKYNQRMLFDKAKGYADGILACAKAVKEKESITETILKTKELLESEREHLEEIRTEERVRQEEKESLGQKDAIRLKDEEQKLDNKCQELEKQKAEKKQQECTKQEDWNTASYACKEQEEKNEQSLMNIEEYLDEMTELMEGVPFDDSQFFIEELREQKEETISFEGHLQEFERYKKKVEDGIQILKEEERLEKEYSRQLEILDGKKELRNQAEKELSEAEMSLYEEREELIEQFYKWNQSNEIFCLEESVLQQINTDIEQYRFGSDFTVIQDRLQGEKAKIKDDLQDQKADLKEKLKPVEKEVARLQEELQMWETKREPEPEQSTQVQANRQKLDELQIPYYQFYKTVEFEDSLEETQAGRLEEALMQMGILDALIIPDQYRKKVLELDAGLCDKYIFGDVASVKHNLTAWLAVDNRENDIIFYQQISKAISAIGCYEGDSGTASTWIDREGNYKIGILEGNVSKTYQPRYIGATARERYKQDMIENLQRELSVQKELEQELRVGIGEIETKIQQLEAEWMQVPTKENLVIAAKILADVQFRLDNIKMDIRAQEEQLEKLQKPLQEVRLQVQEICAKTYLTIRLDIFEETLGNLNAYEKLLNKTNTQYEKYQNGLRMCATFEMQMEKIDEDLDQIRREIFQIERELQSVKASMTSVQEQLALTDYESIKERLDICTKRLDALPKERDKAVQRCTNLENEVHMYEEKNVRIEKDVERLQAHRQQLRAVFFAEYELHYVQVESYRQDMQEEHYVEKLIKTLESQMSGALVDIDNLQGKIQAVFHENKAYLADYSLTIEDLFSDLKEHSPMVTQRITRIGIQAKYRGSILNFQDLVEKLKADAEEQERLLSDKDRELFEDILTNTISKKIRAKIHKSKRWVGKMNELMESMQTSSGLRLSLKWKSKKAEKEEQLDTSALVELLQKDGEIMREEEIEKLSLHFRSKIAEARKRLEDVGNTQSFHMIMKEILDYRKWFEFQLECQKTGEKKKELTDRVFFTFSGGEKAMAMYVPLFSAVVAKYAGAREDAPYLISLDEAFAGVDEMNIKDMFRLMVEFEFDFMINSQILWGDYETVPSIAIYQLIRPQNAKFVSIIPYVWNGKVRELVEQIKE